MDRKAELQVTLEEARKALQEINEQERKDAMEAHVGRFFKYLNSYSCPNGPEDRWWLYAAVKRVKGDIVRFSFQIDKDGKIDFEMQPFFLSDGWKQIARREYSAEFQKAKRTIEKLSKL